MYELSDESGAPRGELTKFSPRNRASARRGIGLGVFSVGLGLAELLAPAGVASLIGIPSTRRTRLVLRALGVRELLAGVGLLAEPRSAGWLWSRVAGDAMDLALLGEGFTQRRAKRGRLAAATAVVASVTAIDALSAARQSRDSTLSQVGAPIHVFRTITINREPEAVYEFWRDLTNLPTFMAHLESVQNSGGRSVWRAKGPAGTTISWEAEVVMDKPGECLAWRSVDGSTTVPNRGVVRFNRAPGGRGTEVQVELKYEPPGGAVGAAVAKLFGEEPAQQVAGDLRRLKQVLETGEVLHSDASIHRGPHPARPAEDDDALEVKGAAQ
jgi:uncharacterized membrane protein